MTPDETPRRALFKTVLRMGKESDFRRVIGNLTDDVAEEIGATASGLYLAGSNAYLFLEGLDDPLEAIRSNATTKKWFDGLARHSDIVTGFERPQSPFVELTRAPERDSYVRAPFRGALLLTQKHKDATAFDEVISALPQEALDDAGIEHHSVFRSGEGEILFTIEARDADFLDRLVGSGAAAETLDAFYRLTDFDPSDPNRRRLTDVRDLAKLRAFVERIA